LKLPRLKETRELQGVSQLDLAQVTGVSLASISGYETGERSADSATAWKLATALAVPVERLMLESRQAARPGTTSRLARTSADRIREESLRARLEYAFPQLFDSERLPNEQIDEAFESAYVILGALGRTMLIEADSFFEAMHPTLTAAELRKLCVAFYFEELIRKGEAASKQRSVFRE
jgi:transcriptional regulator with XRE-family HTH domain